MTLDEKSDDFYERSCGSASADTSYTQDVEHISDQSLWSIRNNYSSGQLLYVYKTCELSSSSNF